MYCPECGTRLTDNMIPLPDNKPQEHSPKRSIAKLILTVIYLLLVGVCIVWFLVCLRNCIVLGMKHGFLVGP